MRILCWNCTCRFYCHSCDSYAKDFKRNCSSSTNKHMFAEWCQIWNLILALIFFFAWQDFQCITVHTFRSVRVCVYAMSAAFILFCCLYLAESLSDNSDKRRYTHWNEKLHIHAHKHTAYTWWILKWQILVQKFGVNMIFLCF